VFIIAGIRRSLRSRKND